MNTTTPTRQTLTQLSLICDSHQRYADTLATEYGYLAARLLPITHDSMWVTPYNRDRALAVQAASNDARMLWCESAQVRAAVLAGA